MGEMADFALEQIETDCENFLRWQTGQISDLEAEDLGILNEHGRLEEYPDLVPPGDHMKSATRKLRRPAPASPSREETPEPESKTARRTQLLKLPGPNDINEPPESFFDYTTIIFGEKGIGKSSLAAEFPDNLTIMLEPRRKNLRIRMVSEDPQGGDITWNGIVAYTEAACEDKTVKTITYDTIDRVWDLLVSHKEAEYDVKSLSKLNDGGAAWREVTREFESLMNAVKDCGRVPLFLSHAMYRQVEARNGDEAFGLCVPTCKPACHTVMKAICDFAFYYGYFNKQREMYLRGSNDIWAACGTNEHFLDTRGNPLERIPMGNNPHEAMENLLAGYNNEIEFEEEETTAAAKVPPRKTK